MSDRTLAEFVAAHEATFDQYRELCDHLTNAQLGEQSLCPDWDVRAVLGHAIGVEVVLDGWNPSAEDPPPFEQMAEFTRELANLDPTELAGRISAVTKARLEHLRSLDAEVVDRPSITPVGVHTYGRFLQIRVFDLWVHARDIALPLGERIGDSGMDAEMALDEVEAAMGYVVGKKIGLPQGKSIRFNLTGGVERTICVAVNGRAAVVESLDAPDVELFTDTTTFVMLGAGRIDPQEQIDSAAVSWRGDDQWGERVARNLAYTV